MTLPEELRGNTEKEIVDTYLSRNAGKVWVPAVAVAAWFEAGFGWGFFFGLGTAALIIGVVVWWAT